jgi:hypothetical protein
MATVQEPSSVHDPVGHINQRLPLATPNFMNQTQNLATKTRAEWMRHAVICLKKWYQLNGQTYNYHQSFHLLADSVKKLYRPDPNKSIQEQLYSPENNPSPLLDLIKRMYAFSATGKAVIWIMNDAEATSMKNVLKVTHLVFLHGPTFLYILLHAHLLFLTISHRGLLPLIYRSPCFRSTVTDLTSATRRVTTAFSHAIVNRSMWRIQWIACKAGVTTK